ncbi:peptidase M61 [Croceibacterium mercuriale]|uniref:Peptidase M61 n=1 Tax=Croceibacterium mercuriale TaxID=1572751 RepID=A0A0B2BYY6_9SPHN|nr:M61 family metallopeptidase [Croceibacterium mercuriale]KHL24906.1 peptidase M61 [Croceibacterium mercuriale]
MIHSFSRAALAALLLATASQPALAQGTARSAPVAAALPAPLPDAQDVRYPGTVTLDIDATDIVRNLYRVTQTFPVQRGTDELILQLPEWLPGNHGPKGPLNQIAQISFSVDGKPVNWTRDPVEVYAFRIPLPANAREVTASFVHTSPISGQGRISMTPEMLNLQWEKMSLYPAGHYVRQILVKPTVTFPEGWTVFTALDGQTSAGGRGNRVTWDPTDYEVLVDSPVFAGEHAESWQIGRAMEMNVIADEARLLAIKPENMQTYNRLMDEAVTLFGSRPFDHYEFLLGLTDKLGGIGLEHHRSSENTYEPTTFIDWDTMGWDRNVIAHELVHSWNGKYRRPAGLWTPDYREPMRDNLLWMYEGQTQFWGLVLAARSGIQPKDVVLGAMATSAGYYSKQPGRAWRSVEDTTMDPIINSRRSRPYTSLHRDEDYYNEGALMWLEADGIIRNGTNGAKGLDDFAKIFFAAQEGDYGQRTYDFDEIADTLNQVFPHDWRAFLTLNMRTAGLPAPVEGIEAAGYRLVWKEEPNPARAGQMASTSFLDLLYSLGVNLSSSGEVTQTLWDGPAFRAGLVDGMSVVSVDGQEYSADAMKAAITAAKTSKQPIRLIVKRDETITPLEITYDGGLQYPWLEPAAEGEQALDRLLTARATAGAAMN